MTLKNRNDGVSGRFKPVQMVLVSIGLAAGIGVVYFLTRPEPKPPASAPEVIAKVGTDEVQLTKQQAVEMNVGPVSTVAFEARREAVGIIDLNQDAAVQVFSPYQGRIGSLNVRAGDDVASGQVLYTVQIPDLATAASLLISTSGALKVANQTLQRAQSLSDSQSIPIKELQQNTADQQAADANYRAARKTLSLFGLANSDIEAIESTRKVDTEMLVRSPFGGRITARAGAVGQLVQPGSGTAPLMVANLQTLWMVASVPESDVASYRLGQSVAVKVSAYPEERFTGKISYIGDMADPASHRFVVRADVANAKRLLKPQMLASFTITLGPPSQSVAIPVNAIAREGDGSMSVWVTQDGTRFKRRKVRTGLMQDGMVQIVEGLTQDEKVARDRALFMSNLYLTNTN